MKNCNVCGDLISPNAPTVKLIYGFGGEMEMHHIVVHVDCIHNDDVVDRLLEEFETEETDF